MLIGEVDREIIELFSEDIAAFYSINQIAKRLGKKYPYINRRVSFLIDQGILRKSVLGNTYLCSVNLGNDTTIAMLSLVEIERRNVAAQKQASLSRLSDEIKGSRGYAGLVCLILSKERVISVYDTKKQAAAGTVKIKGLVGVSIDRQEFLELLCSGGITKDHIILYGFERYFEMVREVEKELRSQQIHEIA